MTKLTPKYINHINTCYMPTSPIFKKLFSNWLTRQDPILMLNTKTHLEHNNSEN